MSIYNLLFAGILVLYLTRGLSMDNSTAMAVYHAFQSIIYIFPIAGGILSDSTLGKFKWVNNETDLMTMGGNETLTFSSNLPWIRMIRLI